MSESSFSFFAFVFLISDSYSYHLVSLSSCRPSPSLNPPPTSGQSPNVPLCAEPRDLGCTVGKVVVRPSDDAVADSPTPEVTVATAVGSSEEVARAS